ncbi:thiamine pyrophosphate-dependent enzyme [Sorangium sp. So ce302]|uniref:thiamine pyrophosphate-dependent enzyme n=1 Tax=Sorangium sp. So ce302 TaxID=3133297 RepID=UPI003F624D59
MMTAAEGLVALLDEDLGVKQAFGVIGGNIACFYRALAKSSIEVLQCRHEAGAAFMATEASLAIDRPSIVFSTSGPGLTNAMTGALAARWEGAQVILVSGATSPAQRGRWAIQETGGSAMWDVDRLGTRPFFDYAASVERSSDLAQIGVRLAAGTRCPSGFVAHISLPMDVQSAPIERPLCPFLAPMGSFCDTDVATFCGRLLAGSKLVIWIGFGARRAWRAVRALAELTGAPVMCSPRAKGIFPEDHPQFLGVTGLGGHSYVQQFLGSERPEYVLVLGSRIGEATSFWSPSFSPTRAFVHVDLDLRVFGAAYPCTPTIAVQAEIDAFVRTLIERWPPLAPRASPPPPRRAPPLLPPRATGMVRPRYLMDAIQRKIVLATDAIVIAESGNAFVLATHCLEFARARRYRMSSGFGSMGHAAAGVVGAALATRAKAVALVGDGAMLMQNEICTAVRYGVPAVWVVLNDARYGMVEQGARALGWPSFETAIPRADFVMIARGMGADGVRVERETELDAALDVAVAAGGPFVVDVIVDPREEAPSYGRNDSLMNQGMGRKGGQGS